MLKSVWLVSNTGPNSAVNTDATATATSPNNTSITVSNNSSSSTFTTTFLAITFSWLIVALWQRVIDNFTFGTLGMNENSTFHALIIAVAITTLFIITIWIIDIYQLVPGGIEKTVTEGGGPNTPTAPVAPSGGTSSGGVSAFSVGGGGGSGTSSGGISSGGISSGGISSGGISSGGISAFSVGNNGGINKGGVTTSYISSGNTSLSSLNLGKVGVSNRISAPSTQKVKVIRRGQTNTQNAITDFFGDNGKGPFGTPVRRVVKTNKKPLPRLI